MQREIQSECAKQQSVRHVHWSKWRPSEHGLSASVIRHHRRRAICLPRLRNRPTGRRIGLNQHPSNYTPGKRPDNRVAAAAAVLSDGLAGRPHIGSRHLAINGLIRDGVIVRRSDADRWRQKWKTASRAVRVTVAARRPTDRSDRTVAISTGRLPSPPLVTRRGRRVLRWDNADSDFNCRYCAM